MRGYLTPQVLANTIRLGRTVFTGAFLLVEGDTDARFYRRVIDGEKCRIIDGRNKEMALETLKILEGEGFPGVAAIVDADFCAIEGVQSPSSNVLTTDAHDLEAMIIRSPALEKVLDALGSEEKLARVTKPVREALLDMASPIGSLRLVSLRRGLNLRFEGLRFGAFIDEARGAVGLGQLVRAARNHSQRPDLNEDELEADIREVLDQGYDRWHLCCGHDLVAVLSQGLCKIWGTNRRGDVNAEITSRYLRVSFEGVYFENTALWRAIIRWEDLNLPYRILRR